MSTTATQLAFRDVLTPADRAAIEAIVVSTGNFRPDEVAVAIELVDDRLAKGPASEYYFVLAERAGQLVGYACYGPIACALGSYDLYWIAVAKSLQGAGLGRQIMAEVERLVAATGGRKVYLDTSSQPSYEPTRAFYDRCGYAIEAELPDFYAAGDNKVIYAKRVAAV